MFKCNTMSRLCRKEMGQKHRRDSTKHVAVFLPEGTCNNKKVGLNLIFGGTLGTSSVLKRSRRNKQRKHNSFFTSPSLKLFQNRAWTTLQCDARRRRAVIELKHAQKPCDNWTMVSLTMPGLSLSPLDVAVKHIIRVMNACIQATYYQLTSLPPTGWARGVNTESGGSIYPGVTRHVSLGLVSEVAVCLNWGKVPGWVRINRFI